MIPKFRAWDREGEVMCEVDVIGFSEGAVTISNENVKYYHLGINEIELMQYTGLKDKNGAEIYEGDIVAYIDKHGQKRIGKINYANAKYYIGNFETLGYAGERYELEVIGNIWEDGDLLDSE